jgi:hypothetical protein
MMKPFAIALSRGGEGLEGEGDGGDKLTNIQRKVILNFHNESPSTINTF